MSDLKKVYLDGRIAGVLFGIWTIIVTWVVFFTRWYDGDAYGWACFFTWISGIVILFFLSADFENW